MTKRKEYGFTLVELSIVLIIIGLIIGGILMGRDLINAAASRAQISQIEQFNEAVYTFYGKYGFLPGDIKDPYASNFGLSPRGPYAGQGDGNGLLQGNYGNNPSNNTPEEEATGESGMFWVDLTYANGMKLNLIPGSFSTATPTAVPGPVTGSSIGKYFPSAKIGSDQYVYVYSEGLRCNDTYNYFGLSAVTDIGTTASGTLDSNATMTVQQAYNIDSKIDDGLPQSGRVTAVYENRALWLCPTWAGTGTNTSFPYTTATQGTSTSCFDNGNVTGATQQYSLEQNGGNGPNCALSFRMQMGN